MTKIILSLSLLLSTNAFAMTLADMGKCPGYYTENSPFKRINELTAIKLALQDMRPIEELDERIKGVTNCGDAAKLVNEIADKYKDEYNRATGNRTH